MRVRRSFDQKFDTGRGAAWEPRRTGVPITSLAITLKRSDKTSAGRLTDAFDALEDGAPSWWVM
jgi:hypothetical protein